MFLEKKKTQVKNVDPFTEELYESTVVKRPRIQVAFYRKIFSNGVNTTL